MASYPFIDVTKWNEMYSTWDADTENRPLINRATMGAYAPGSTYKILTAIAGLEEGVIDENTLIDCQHYYTRFSKSRTYKCMVALPLKRAARYSEIVQRLFLRNRVPARR